MSAGWTPWDLLTRLRERGSHPAVIVAGEAGLVTVTAAALATQVVALAHELRAAGGERGTRVGLCGPNGPAWIVSAVAVLAGGCVLVPIDNQCDAEQFEHALATSDARMLIAPAARLEAAADVIERRDLRSLRLDALASTGSPHAQSSATLVPLPTLSQDDTMVLSWTSGTTGSPKIFALSLRNIASNVAAIDNLRIVGEADRALLPLPLHHAYPFVVGMLAMLTVGTTIVLPAETTGPLILQALRDGAATAIVGVPRLYEAIVATLEARVAARGIVTRFAWHASLGIASWFRRTGLEVGRLLFLPVRHGIAPRLRLLVSGGARLDPAVEERLATLGWLVLSGYGLAETASMFTANVPRDRRIGSAGKPLGGGEVRIDAPDAQGVGEVQLRGPAVTSGYLNNPEANASAFAEGGWFRTGDLGFVDRDGFLFVTGRVKEVLVLGGGKKINPEDLEAVYATAPGIAEIGLLEVDNALVALVRPDLEAQRALGVTNPRDGVRVALAVKARDLPSYERLAGFAVADEPLPRTRLGKLRRFLLPTLYARALAGVQARTPRALTGDDVALLRDPRAAGIWDLLRQRYPGRAIDLDVSPELDLNLDSFGWMELTAELERRFGVVLSEADIAAIHTIRDLLRIAAARRGGAARGAPVIAVGLDRWLAPIGPWLLAAGAMLFVLNRLFMRTAFRLRVRGMQRLPVEGAFVLTPNHASYLDPLAVAAAMPLSRIRRLYWAGMLRLFQNPASRLFSRVVHLFPVDETHPDAAVTAALRVLADGKTLVWFPEGWRSPDGNCQRFLPGIAQLLLRGDVPAVPVRIEGAFEALPRTRRLPRPHRITLTFGDPVRADVLRAEGAGESDEARIADGLRRRVMALARE